MGTSERAGSLGAQKGSAWARNRKESVRFTVRPRLHISASFTSALLTAPTLASRSDLNPINVSFPASFPQIPFLYSLPTKTRDTGKQAQGVVAYHRRNSRAETSQETSARRGNHELQNRDHWKHSVDKSES